MQSLSDIFRRNRTVILLFTVLVIMPSVFLGYLGFRAVRSNNAEQQFQQRNRQREIALLLNDALKQVKPSTRAWFEVARNYAMFANEGGVYDDLLAYMRAKKI